MRKIQTWKDPNHALVSIEILFNGRAAAFATSMVELLARSLVYLLAYLSSQASNVRDRSYYGKAIYSNAASVPCIPTSHADHFAYELAKTECTSYVCIQLYPTCDYVISHSFLKFYEIIFLSK